MKLVLKKNASRKVTFYKALTGEVLGEKVQMGDLTAEATLQCKNLDEDNYAEELAAALRWQCVIDAAYV